MRTPKALRKDESTFMNGGGELGSGSMCGGVINESRWQQNLKENGGYGLMMAYVMPDDKFELYKKAKESGDEKTAHRLFEKHAHSNI